MPVWLRRGAGIAALAYVAFFVAWQGLLRLVAPGSWWPLEVGEIFAVWFYLPLVVLGPLALAARQRWASAALVVPMAAFLVTYGSVWLPRPARAVAAAETPTLRVMTWNTWRTRDEEGTFLAAVDQLTPDVIALQEVSGSLAARARELDAAYPYRTYALAGGTSSLMVLSRWPITEEVKDIDWLGCHCLQVEIDWRGQPVRVVNVHVWSPDYKVVDKSLLPIVTGFRSAHQRITVDALLEDLGATTEPLVVMGDFNTADRQPNHTRLVASGLVDSQEAAGWGLGLTYPARFTSVAWLPFPLIRIDYVFAGRSFTPIALDTVYIKGSDHMAVVADLVLH